MLDEILSGFIGSTIAEIVSKLAPPRKSSEFAAVPFETVERRNKPFYFAALSVFVFGFFLPYPFIHVGHGGAGWFVGAIFGLPFRRCFSTSQPFGVCWAAKGPVN